MSKLLAWLVTPLHLFEYLKQRCVVCDVRQRVAVGYTSSPEWLETRRQAVENAIGRFCIHIEATMLVPAHLMNAQHAAALANQKSLYSGRTITSRRT